MPAGRRYPCGFSMDIDRLLISLDNALRTLSGAVHASRPCPAAAPAAERAAEAPAYSDGYPDELWQQPEPAPAATTCRELSGA